MSVTREFHRRIQALLLEETGDLRAAGKLGEIPTELWVEGSRQRTCARVALRPALDLGLHVDDDGTLVADEASRVDALFGREARDLIDDLAADQHLDASDAFIEVSIDRGFSGRDPQYVHETDIKAAAQYARSLSELASLARKRAATAPVAAPLRPLVGALDEFARAHGLSVLHAPLAVFGNVSEIGLSISAERLGQGEHRARGRVWPDGKALDGMSLTNAANVGGDWVEAAGEDVSVADDAFSKRFRVRAINAEAARAALHADARRWFVTEADRGCAIAVSDGMVELSDIALDGTKPDQLAALGDRLLRLASLLSVSSANAPYR